MLLLKYAARDSKKPRFIKKQEAKGLLNMIGKTLILGPSLI